MNTSLILKYLQKLSENNNREWFNSNKNEYEKVRIEFDYLLSSIIERISTFDDSIKGLEPKHCTYRIYRDTRFSFDKTPYKTHIGGYINAKGKKSSHFGYYIHIEPGNCLLSGGSLCISSEILKAMRESIYNNIEEFVSIVEDPQFKQYFPIIGENALKTSPKGFDKNFIHLDYLKFKQYTPAYKVSDDFFLNPNFLDRTEDVFRQFKRFSDFMNFTIDDFE